MKEIPLNENVIWGISQASLAILDVLKTIILKRIAKLNGLEYQAIGVYSHMSRVHFSIIQRNMSSGKMDNTLQQP